MDFKPKLYNVAIGLLLGIMPSFVYSRGHLSYGIDRFLYHFLIGLGFIFILSYVVINLIKKRW